MRSPRPKARAPKVDGADDSFGAALLDWVKGGDVCEVIERDDGHREDGAGRDGYLTPLRGWPKAERAVLRHLQRGPIIDVGCGAGRVALVLQERGHEVVGLDASPLAIKAAQAMGVRETRCGDLASLADDIGDFNSLLLFGNNFGIFGTPAGARRILTGWSRHARPGARLYVESTNPYFGGAPIVDRTYYWRNKSRGLPPGQTEYRILYQDLVGPWMPWLFVSQGELRAVVRGTGWAVAKIFGDGPIEPYVAVLERG